MGAAYSDLCQTKVLYAAFFVCLRGEMIHQIYGAWWFSGHDSGHGSFSMSFDTALFTPV